MKKALSILTAVVLFLLLPLSVSQADGYSTFWDSESQFYRYEGQVHYGIVICTRMNVRKKASTSSSALGSIRNGQPVKILGTSQKGDFYVLDLESCGIRNSSAEFGFAKTSLIKVDPEFIAASRLLNLYATPWGDGLKNGEQSNRFFLVISQNNNWYAVQTTESYAGTSFIRTSDITPVRQTRYLVTWDAPLYDENTMSRMQTIERYTIGYRVAVRGDYSLLLFNRDEPDEFRAMIPNQYIAPLLN